MTNLLSSQQEGVTHGVKPSYLSAGSLEMGANMERTLRATPTIDADHGNIVETAKRVTSRCSSDQQMAVSLFYFVWDTSRYNIDVILMFIEDFRAATSWALQLPHR